MPRMKTAAADESRVLSRRVLAVVDRDMTAKTPRVVWQHEIPILEAVFGEGKVQLVEPEKLDEGYTARVSPELLPFNKVQDEALRPSQSNGIGWVFVGDARAEYERLGAVYGNMTDEPRLVVEAVYGRFQDGRFAAVVGAAEVEDLPEDQLRELIRGYGFIPAVSTQSTDAEKTAAKAKSDALRTASKPQLLTIAEELGVSIN